MMNLYLHEDTADDLHHNVQGEADTFVLCLMKQIHVFLLEMPDYWYYRSIFIKT